jgi:hypothetical protein
MRLGIVPLALLATVLVPVVASADGNCGPSNGQTLCVTVPGGPLSGDSNVTVTNSPNTGVVIATWLPAGGTSTQLIESFASSPATTDYSFVWPTQKYLDASGTLRLQAGSTAAAPVDLAVTLGQREHDGLPAHPERLGELSPGRVDGRERPTVIAVGDGPSNEVTSNTVAARIASVDPPLFLFLGDVYETGSFTEFRNHYGVSSLDAPGSSTLWGATADVTQPTIGNHENASTTPFVDYWHQRPLFTKFTFGGVLFLDMNSNKSLKSGTRQYRFIQTAVTDPCRTQLHRRLLAQTRRQEQHAGDRVVEPGVGVAREQRRGPPARGQPASHGRGQAVGRELHRRDPSGAPRPTGCGVRWAPARRRIGDPAGEPDRMVEGQDRRVPRADAQRGGRRERSDQHRLAVPERERRLLALRLRRLLTCARIFRPKEGMAPDRRPP